MFEKMTSKNIFKAKKIRRSNIRSKIFWRLKLLLQWKLL